VRVTVSQIFRNCPRYVHRYTKTKPSEYVPRSTCETPLASVSMIYRLRYRLKTAPALSKKAVVILRAEYEKYLAHLNKRE
jgi:hypothetical protein